MNQFQIPIFKPGPTEASSLPGRQALILLVDALVPASTLCQRPNPLFDKLALAFLRLRQCTPILRPKGICFEKPVPAHGAPDLLQRMRYPINKTFGSAPLDEVRNFLLEAIVEGERVDDGSLAAGRRRSLAEEDDVGGEGRRDGVFIVPADKVAWWAPSNIFPSEMLPQQTLLR